MHPFVKDPHMRKLWQGFEDWLVRQFPKAYRIVTPFSDPIARSIEEYQEFLASMGYVKVAKALKSGKATVAELSSKYGIARSYIPQIFRRETGKFVRPIKRLV